MKSKMLAHDHDDAGQHEAIDGERPGGRDVDEHADEGQDVGMDAERDAGAMIARSGNMQMAPMAPVKVMSELGVEC